MLEGERSTTAQMAAAADYIRAQLESYGYEVSTDPVLNSENLIAELSGTTCPEEIFLLGANFDTAALSPGADGNASGVAATLEIARAMAGSRFESSIQFVAFALNHSGLLGSAQLVQDYQDAGVSSEERSVLGRPVVGHADVWPIRRKASRNASP